MSGRPDGAATEPYRPLPWMRRWLQLALVVLFAAVGVGGFWLSARLKKPPEKREVRKVVRAVRVQEVHPTAAKVVLVGHGTARAKYRIPLAVEVGGKVILVSPKLKAGHRVAKGTVLVEIEPDTYRIARAQAEAERLRLGEQIGLLTTKLVYDRKRLGIAERAADLAQRELQRVAKLLKDDEVGTQAGVDAAEGAYLQRMGDVIALKDAIAASPLRVKELEASLAAAKARLEQADLNLSRTRVVAPFDARVESADVQVGQVVSVGRAGPGAELAVLSDLAVIEVPVALDNDELRWLPITAVDERGEYAFAKNHEVKVRWIQDAERGDWRGRISRLERFEAETRTLTLVVEVTENRAAAPKSGSMQLAEGMFCRVEIPGLALPAVYRVPRALLRQNGTLPVFSDGKLELRTVRVARTQGDDALIDRGLEPGDRVVLTPIVNPVPGMEIAIEGVPPADEGAPPADGDAPSADGDAPSADGGSTKP